MLPEIFQKTVFTRPRKQTVASRFIRPIHPKTEIRPDFESVQKVLDAGWVGQLKVDGHRAQVHISAHPDEKIRAYNRQGSLHKLELSVLLQEELRRLFTPKENWNVIDAEWLKKEEKLFVFDFLKKDGELLDHKSYCERWNLLPRAYISPVIKTLGILTNSPSCLQALREGPPFVEGLVFKSPSKGFEDSSIVRCRKVRSF